MTLLHLHQDDAPNLAGMTMRSFERLRDVLVAMRRAIGEARARQFELMFDDGDGNGGERWSECGAVLYPRQPLILGDKWDF